MKQTQTDWQGLYESRETPWEKGLPHPALVDFLATDGPIAGRICVPGCGSGNDVRALSTLENRVLGIDFAPLALEKARSHERVGNEEYLLADLFALPPEFDRKFDVVFEHTCFCAIDPARRAEYAEAIVRLVKPGGQFIAIFFPNPDLDDGEKGPPFPVSVDELAKTFGRCFTLEREWVPQRTHPGREGRELMRVLKRAKNST
ncbi:MAG: methyltransferase domain-containing protein [Chthoniobacterales bacterium]